MGTRQLHRLSSTQIRASKPGDFLADGGGLYFQHDRKGPQSWVFRYRAGPRERYLGLGPTHTVTLAEARQKATECRRLLLEGRDPVAEAKARKASLRLQAGRAITFDQAAEEYIATHKAAWRSDKHGDQWRSTLKTYCSPAFGAVPIADVDASMIVRALGPIWLEKAETASRVRMRIEAILNWATANGHREGLNPARLKGHLDHLLPTQKRVRKVVHHAALAYGDLPDFVSDLRSRNAVTARALEWLILTATRTGETLGARWEEVDVREGVWTIPPGRMKGGREHRIPLPAGALAILEAMKEIGRGEYVFPGQRPGKPLSNMALLVLLRRMGRGDLTAHGFRSTFRDWAAEQTAFPGEVAEMALAHAISDKTEAAYRRGDLFEKRRRLMDAWGVYCGSPPTAAASIVSLRGA